MPRVKISKAEQIVRFRKLTGLGWLEARLFLAGRSATLCERIVTAKERQSQRILHDPIEDEPAFAVALADAREVAQGKLQEWVLKRNQELKQKALHRRVADRHRGGCHLLWREMKRELRHKHGIEWFSPRDMNPGTKFD